SVTARFDEWRSNGGSPALPPSRRRSRSGRVGRIRRGFAPGAEARDALGRLPRFEPGAASRVEARPEHEQTLARHEAEISGPEVAQAPSMFLGHAALGLAHEVPQIAGGNGPDLRVVRDGEDPFEEALCRLRLPGAAEQRRGRDA